MFSILRTRRRGRSGERNQNRANNTRSSRSRLKMFAWITVLLFGSAVLLLVAAVYISSSEHPKPFLDADGKPLAGSISEKVFVEINGLKQGLIIKGKSLSNPVLLYLHGGMPDFFLPRPTRRGWKIFSLWCGGSRGESAFPMPATSTRKP